MQTNASFDPERATVHDVVERRAGAMETFGRFGIDTCCGGDLPVAEAARRHGVELEALLAALDVAGAEEPDGPRPPPAEDAATSPGAPSPESGHVEA